MSNSELATSYAALILADDDVPITSENLLKLTQSANVEVEPIWTSLFAKALDGKDVKQLLLNIGSGSPGPAAPTAGAASSAAEPEKKEESKKEQEEEESDEDMGFSLFD